MAGKQPGRRATQAAIAFARQVTWPRFELAHRDDRGRYRGGRIACT
jgi:hypothetical protein